MKYCQKCGTKNPEEAKFCGACGYKFHTENSQQEDPQVQEEIRRIQENSNLLKRINPHNFNIYCGYGVPERTICGELIISQNGITWEKKAKSITGFLTILGSLGQASKANIAYENISSIVIAYKGYSLLIVTSDGKVHCFSGPHLLSANKNKKCIKKLGYLIELYRRLYKFNYGLLQCVSSNRYVDDMINLDAISYEELVKYYETL